MAAGMNLSRTSIALALAVSCSLAHAFEPVTVAGEPALQVQWQPAREAGRRPTVIALHGCSGLHSNSGRFDDRYISYARRWNAAGWHVVAPDSFTFVLAVTLFVGLVVGGVGSIPGTIAGGFFILFVPNIAESVSKGLAGAVYGVILMVVIYVMPTGAAGLVRLITSKMVRQGR